ncbi:MAG: TetR/AcrR family transcriptional regulator [Chitinophagaceae bacterium]
MVKNKIDKTAEEKILLAAKKVFTTHGMAGARMQDIADEAGINKALLHYYFRDKEKLFEVIFMEEAQKFFPKINSIFESALPLFEKIERFCDEYITEMMHHPYLAWFIMNELNRDPEKFLNSSWAKANLPNPIRLVEQMEREIKKGTIRRIQPVHLLMHLLSMTVFPFIAKPMMQKALQMDDAHFKKIMEERRKEIPRFIIESIRK